MSRIIATVVVICSENCRGFLCVARGDEGLSHCGLPPPPECGQQLTLQLATLHAVAHDCACLMRHSRVHSLCVVH